MTRIDSKGTPQQSQPTPDVRVDADESLMHGQKSDPNN